MSSRNGLSTAPGAAKAIGLVPNFASRAPVGTTEAATVLVVAMPISPSRVAISAYQPAAPK